MVFKNIKDLRTDADLSQLQVAKMLNCNRTVYGRYETGISEIPVWVLIKLADYYNVSTDYLLGRTKIKRPYAPE